MELYRSHVLVCGGTGCTSSGSAKLIERFEEQLKEKGLDKEVKVVRTGCFGLCEAGPVVIVYPEGTFYSRVKEEDVDEIVSEHLLKGRKVQRLVYVDHKTHESSVQKSLGEIGFYKQQMRVALRNCGVIDPENIDEYIAFDGYKALAKALTEMMPARRSTSTSSATLTRATPARSWTAPCWKAIPTQFWKPWPSADTRSVRTKAGSTFVRSIPSP